MIIFLDLLGQEDVIKINFQLFLFPVLIWCISLLGLPWQNTTDKQNTNNAHRFSHSFGGWKSEIKVPAVPSHEALSGCSLVFRKWGEDSLPPWGLYPVALWWWWQPWQSLNHLWDHTSLLWKDNASLQLDSSGVLIKLQMSNHLPSFCPISVPSGPSPEHFLWYSPISSPDFCGDGWSHPWRTAVIA